MVLIAFAEVVRLTLRDNHFVVVAVRRAESVTLLGAFALLLVQSGFEGAHLVVVMREVSFIFDIILSEVGTLTGTNFYHTVFIR